MLPIQIVPRLLRSDLPVRGWLDDLICRVDTTQSSNVWKVEARVGPYSFPFVVDLATFDIGLAGSEEVLGEYLHEWITNQECRVGYDMCITSFSHPIPILEISFEAKEGALWRPATATRVLQSSKLNNVLVANHSHFGYPLAR